MNTVTLTITGQTITAPIQPYSTYVVPTDLHCALLTIGGQNIDFYQFQQQYGLPPQIQDIEILHNATSLSISDDIRNNILLYLQNPQLRLSFDCHKFMHFCRQDLVDVFAIQKDVFQSGELYTPGSFAQIINEEGRIVHSQIYLGNDLFLSKGGNKGPLIISTTDQMEKLWGGEKTVIEKNM